MSANNPGVIYDATNSWNGYNHQGKISMWYAISEILKIYNPSLSEADNKAELENYFLEIEYMEDFSIGKIENGNPSYISVHQVKNRVDKSIKSYGSAILGLLAHLSEYSDIKSAMLHTTEDVALADKSLLDNVKEFTKTPQYLIDAENEVNDNRNDLTFREALTIKRRGRPTTLKTNLVNALTKKDSSSKKLNGSNLDEAFDLYLADINAEKAKLLSLSDEQLKKVSICTYTLNGTTTNYCCVDCAVELLQSAIKDFYQMISPGSYRATTDFAKTSYLWMLGKLDDHIIERDLHYDLYAKDSLNRRISFSTIFDWLNSSEIDQQSTWYYLYHIKESFSKEIELFCENCNKKSGECAHCDIVECKNKMGMLDKADFKKFIHITTPMVSGEIDMGTYYKYLQSGINDPFIKGLRDIPQDFSTTSTAIAYKSVDNTQSALTTIAPKYTDNDNGIIASEILRNSNIYELLMDYSCLISKDIAIDSIKSEQIFQTPRFDRFDSSKESDHIMHCKDVTIVPLNAFIEQLSESKEDTTL